MMPVAQDSASSCSSRIRRVWMVSRLWLTSLKSLGIGVSSDYVSFRAEQGQLKPIDRRAVKVHNEYCHEEYCKAAKDLDSKYHNTPDDEIGPVKSALLSFGPVAGKRSRFRPFA